MRSLAVGVVVLFLIAGIGLAGCGAKQASSIGEAIKTSESMGTVEQKTDYLVKQAHAFLDSKDYQGAMQLVQQVLTKLDADSKEAKAILEKARTALEADAKKAMEDVKKKLGF